MTPNHLYDLLIVHGDHEVQLTNVEIIGDATPGKPVHIRPRRQCTCGLMFNTIVLDEPLPVDDDEQLPLEIEEATR